MKREYSLYHRRAGASLLLVLFLPLLLCACPVTPRPADTATDEGASVDEVAELFVPGENPGETYFQTNDSRYWSPVGYTVWGLNGSGQTPFVEREVVCTKISGHDVAGYGVIFSHSGSDLPATDESMLTVMINTLREYIVGEIIGDRFYPFVPWTESPYLSQGYNQSNRIGLVQNLNEYTLYLNGREVIRFTDEETPLHTGGENGYIVVISPLDQFPALPVAVRFTEEE